MLAPCMLLIAMPYKKIVCIKMIMFKQINNAIKLIQSAGIADHTSNKHGPSMISLSRPIGLQTFY